MSSTAVAWLNERAAGVPSSLHEAMLAAAAAADAAEPAAPVYARLAAGALECLRKALEQCDERAAALPLLAADALITSACEAAAADDTPRDPREAPSDRRKAPRTPDSALAALAPMCAPERLAALVHAS